jgi:hypothetical protein
MVLDDDSYFKFNYKVDELRSAQLRGEPSLIRMAENNLLGMHSVETQRQYNSLQFSANAHEANAASSFIERPEDKFHRDMAKSIRFEAEKLLTSSPKKDNYFP